MNAHTHIWMSIGAALLIPVTVAIGAPDDDVADSSAMDEAAVEVAPSPEELAATITTNTASNLISVTLKDEELADVIELFTYASDANIVTPGSDSTNLQGKVSATLKDKDWHTALITILDLHNLTLKETEVGSEIYKIVPKRPDAPEPLIAATIFLKYANVDQIMNAIEPLLDPRAKMAVYPSRNAIVARTTKVNMMEIEDIIVDIDIPRHQVYIEAKFLELDDQAIEDLGINWQVLEGYGIGVGNLGWSYTDDRQTVKTETSENRNWDNARATDESNKKYDTAGNLFEATSEKPTRNIIDTADSGYEVLDEVTDVFTKSISDIRTAVIGADDLRLILSALKQNDGVSFVSNPKIVVANEETAMIHIGETERPFVSTVTPASQNSAAIVTYNPGDAVDFGVKLEVTPTVNTSSNITVKIMPELTRLIDNAVAPNGQTYPIIGKKRIETQFSLQSGKTVAIGGLTETRDVDRVKKVPLLGDIPLIGKYLFSHTHREQVQTETIIFVTVGLANPPEMTREIGLPSNTSLARRHVLRDKVKKAELERDLKTAEEAVEKEIKAIEEGKPVTETE